jgi:hypothetical protein
MGLTMGLTGTPSPGRAAPRPPESQSAPATPRFTSVLAAMIKNRIYLGGDERTEGCEFYGAANFMGWTMGLEPTTAGITIRSSTN